MEIPVFNANSVVPNQTPRSILFANVLFYGTLGINGLIFIKIRRLTRKIPAFKVTGRHFDYLNKCS